ncbi:MAG: hypothetical protein II650_04085 [Clostridia bacterium]|nr:hypothetical protein [Clostridia bacterium]MBQ4350560.1 hypothetical protein [Clostridia bacterium]
MANFDFSVKRVAREALPFLCDNLVFPNLIYRETADAPAAKQGDVVSVRCPVKLEATDFNEEDGVTPGTLRPNLVDVKLDHLATVDMQVGAIEAACDFDSVVKTFIEPAAAALAQKINAEGLALYKDIPGVVKEAHEVSLDDFAEAACILDERRVPAGNRYAVWSPSAARALKQIPAVVNAEKCGSNTALRTGAIGKVFGIENYTSQAVATHESEFDGTLTAASAHTASDALAMTVTGGGPILRGDLLKIGDRVYTATGDGVQSGAVITVSVYPKVTCAANAAITLIGKHTANLVFHPNAFAFVSRPLAAPAGVESYVTTFNGISLRVVRGYDMKYKREMLSMDVLYAFKTIDPALAVRYSIGA